MDEIAATKEDVQQGGVTAALATAAVAMASLSPSLGAQTVTQSPVLMAPEVLPQKSWKCTDCRRLRAFGELLISLSLSLHKNNSSPDRARALPFRAALLHTPLKGEEGQGRDTYYRGHCG